MHFIGGKCREVAGLLMQVCPLKETMLKEGKQTQFTITMKQKDLIAIWV